MQIIVYTGAIMILFLFVLMLVGRDSSDSVVETLRGQRVAAIVLGIGFAGLVGAGIARATQDLPAERPRRRRRAATGNIPAIAELLFTKYLLAFEVTSALLITAAVGAMVLAHIEREPGSRRSQKELSRARFLTDRQQHAARPGCLRPRQLRRRPGDPARRPRGRGLAGHRPRTAGARPDAPTHRPRAARLPGRRARHPRPRAARRRRPMTLTWYLVLAAILFTIGAVGVLVRRNAIVVFMCVELMLNSVNLTLVTFARANGTVDGQIMAFFVMVVAAAEVVVGLAIIMSIYRTRRSASVDDANLLKY